MRHRPDPSKILPQSGRINNLIRFGMVHSFFRNTTIVPHTHPAASPPMA